MTDLPTGQIRELLSVRVPVRLERSGQAEAAVALIVAQSEQGLLEALFIQRAERIGDVWSGHMAFPGGRRSPSDENLLRTAMRETEEETGILLGPSDLIGELDDLHPRTPTLPPIVVRPFVFGLPARPAATPSAEVSAVIWTPLAALCGQQITTDVTVRGVTHAVLGYRLGEQLVWGMTERILSGFLEIVERAGEGRRGREKAGEDGRGRGEDGGAAKGRE